MFTDDVLSFFAFLINGVFGHLPTSPALGLNTLMTNATASTNGHKLFDYLGWANSYFPISDLVTALDLLLGLFAITLILRISLWFYHQFWGSN